MHWEPSAAIETLRARAGLLKKIRAFFETRNVLEVETPLLCTHSVTDPYIQSISAQCLGELRYLQTSPEYAMKRLLAAGSGSIFQISKAFREDEIGKWHHPEFSMLEWYRIDFDHHALMDEMNELLKCILTCEDAERFSYEELFLKHLSINPHTARAEELFALALEKNCAPNGHTLSRDDLLQLLLSHCIEPFLGLSRPAFIYDFPASQAALARLHPSKPHLASRFEVYYQGIELANGFHELADATQQYARFQQNQATRDALKLSQMTIDQYFIAALQYGLPNCAGVALGLDRLLMLQCRLGSLTDTLAFHWHQS